MQLRQMAPGVKTIPDHVDGPTLASTLTKKLWLVPFHLAPQHGQLDQSMKSPITPWIREVTQRTMRMQPNPAVTLRQPRHGVVRRVLSLRTLRDTLGCFPTSLQTLPTNRRRRPCTEDKIQLQRIGWIVCAGAIVSKSAPRKNSCKLCKVR